MYQINLYSILEIHPAPAPPAPLPVVLVVAAVTAAVVVYLSPTTAVSVCPRLIKDTVE